MKLYATVTSERASKGQGGNQFLRIDIMDEDTCFGTVDITPDKKVVINIHGTKAEIEKGERQKGECPHENTEWRDENGKSYLNCFSCGKVLRTKQAP